MRKVDIGLPPPPKGRVYLIYHWDDLGFANFDEARTMIRKKYGVVMYNGRNVIDYTMTIEDYERISDSRFIEEWPEFPFPFLKEISETVETEQDQEEIDRFISSTYSNIIESGLFRIDYSIGADGKISVSFENVAV